MKIAVKVPDIAYFGVGGNFSQHISASNLYEILLLMFDDTIQIKQQHR